MITQRGSERRTRPSSAVAVGDRGSIEIPQSAFHLAGFRDWVKSDDVPEHIRVCYVNGKVYLDMSREEIETHNKVKMELGRALLNLLRKTKQGEFYGDGVLVTNEAAEVSNNPDGMFVSRDSLKKGRIKLVPRTGKDGQYTEIEGSPDCVMEVLSNSSVTKDTKELFDAYHQASIPEYWLIDARGAEIVFTIHYWRKKGYVAAPSTRGWQPSRAFGRSFRLRRQRDELGFWQYTLSVKKV